MQKTQPSAEECADQILTALPVIMRALWQRLQAETPLPVTWAQFGLLSLLYSRPFTLTELARTWGVSKPTMSRTVGLLTGRGWIVSQKDLADRRRKPLSLTPVGREIHERMREIVRQKLVSPLDPLDETQRTQIVSALDLLLRTLA